MAREKELRNFFGNVVSTLRETDAVVTQRASTATDSSRRWHSTRWQVTTHVVKHGALRMLKGSEALQAACSVRLPTRWHNSSGTCALLVLE